MMHGVAEKAAREAVKQAQFKGATYKEVGQTHLAEGDNG